MAIAFVQSTFFNATGTNATIRAYTSANTAGNLLLCFANEPSGTSFAVPTDSLGNTWHLAVTVNGGSALYYAMNCLGGSNTVTLAHGTFNRSAFSIYEFSGAATVGALDQTASNATGTVSVTPLYNGELVFSDYDNSGASPFPTITVGSGWTAAQTLGFQNITPFVASQDGYLVQTTAAAIGNSTWSVSGGTGFYNGTLMASFIPPQPPPTVTSCTPTSGTTGGGTSITNLGGTAFVNGATVTIGGNAATSVAWVSATKLTCVTPSGSSGAKTIIVTNPDSQTGTLTSGYTYLAPSGTASAFGYGLGF